MTKMSRFVLQDAKFAIAAHTDTLQSEGFRISWISIVTLLRAVGHVLEKVDADTSPAMRAVITKKWKQLNQTKPSPEIFWGFIEEERNRFLKNYKHGIVRELVISGPIMDEVQTTLRINVGDGGGEIGSGKNLRSFISSGPFAGKSEREVAWQAYDWWDSYLNEIDALMN